MSAQSDFKVFIKKFTDEVGLLIDDILFNNNHLGKLSVNYQLPAFFDDKEYIVFIYVPCADNKFATSTVVVTQPKIRSYSQSDIHDLAVECVETMHTLITDNGLAPIQESLPFKNQMRNKYQYIREVL